MEHSPTFASLVDALPGARPLVQCLTNTVVMDLTANVLLASGASPAMVETPAESEEFAAVADGVLVNIGTPRAETYAGMEAAVAGANAAGTPWVLDPVACGGLGERTRFAHRIASRGPAAVRANASEIAALAGAGPAGRGTDATAEPDPAVARDLAAGLDAVVAVSGERDLVVSPDGRATRLRAGDPILQRVTGTGCALGALTAAYLGAFPDRRHDAVLAAHAHVGAAARIAVEGAAGPGSFRTAWIDALAAVDGSRVAALTDAEELR